MSKLTDIFKFSKRLAASVLKGEVSSTVKDTNLLSEKHKAYLESKLNDPEYLAKENELLESINQTEGWTAIEKKIVNPVKKRHIWKYAVAASILMLVTLPFVLTNKNTALPDEQTVTSEIKSGTDKATLTLETGEEILLAKGTTFKTSFAESNGEELVYTDPEDVTSTKELVYNYLTIPRGGEFFLKLDDGTKVWLNSESKLKYPINFIKDQPRQVELVYGEAYFEVSPSTLHNGTKFKVTTGNQEIEVLGTEFNVKAYADEKAILTTLVNGKIAWSADNKQHHLSPSEQLVFNKESTEFNLKKVNIYNETSWKNNIFSFKEKPLAEIAVVLSRWYDVDFRFQNEALKSVKFNGVLSKSQSLDNLLKTIINTKIITAYEINDKQILLK
ncbi:FecR family protein [Flavobacteriaceae bacterium F08102]|nr:FecR family protein [Flavobacteriaceae bacterium F08102]